MGARQWIDRTSALPHLLGYGRLNHKDTKAQRHEEEGLNPEGIQGLALSECTLKPSESLRWELPKR